MASPSAPPLASARALAASFVAVNAPYNALEVGARTSCSRRVSQWCCAGVPSTHGRKGGGALAWATCCSAHTAELDRAAPLTAGGALTTIAAAWAYKATAPYGRVDQLSSRGPTRALATALSRGARHPLVPVGSTPYIISFSFSFSIPVLALPEITLLARVHGLTVGQITSSRCNALDYKAHVYGTLH